MEWRRDVQYMFLIRVASYTVDVYTLYRLPGYRKGQWTGDKGCE